MKSLKTLVASLLALTTVGAVSAQTVIRITGSTAYRNATEQAIEVALKPGFVWGGVGKTIGGTQLIYSGNLNNTTGDAVIILTAFTGSEGGVFNLTHPGTPPTNATYIAHDSAHLSHLTTAGYTAFVEGTDTTDTASADISMADTFQSSSLYKSPSLTGTVVGIVPFTWVAATTNDAGITNMTNQLAKAALGNVARLSNWTGNSPDTAAVWVIGRDEDSGTRLTTFAESGFGTTTAPTQYEPVGAAPYTSVAPTPPNTVNGVSYGAGHSGYSSGGNVASAIEAPSITVDSEIIGYIGTSDAQAGLTANTLTPLKWNGITFATAGQSTFAATYNEAVILNGSYTFWGYEHIYQSSAGISADASQAYSLIVNELLTGTEIVTQGSGYNLSDVVNAGLTRSTDGSPVFFNN
jgi:hypothetical protein